MRFALTDVAASLGCTAPAGRQVTGWSVDSRTIAPGDLYFALRGPNHDGHDFARQAAEKGAAGVVAERALGSGAPELVVGDSLRALQRVAAWARSRWAGDVVGVTGSSGKTTSKDAIAAMLSVEMAVGKTEGNFNNQVGVPLSILRLPAGASVAVIEIGMNHAGEIRKLAAIARPRVGVVTNVGYAHIEDFDSIEEVASAKRELIEALPADGVAVLNHDDHRVARFAQVHPGHVITFGLSQSSQVRAEDVEYHVEGVRFRVGCTAFESHLSGRHGVLNLLAGVAVAGEFGVPPRRLRDAVRSIEPGKMRGERLTLRGMTILDDCYNSNPDAARSMVDLLRDTPARRRIAVLGEMLELGRWAEPLHREVGAYVAEQGIDVLVGIRGAARYMVDAAMDAGLAVNAAYFFDAPETAGEYLRSLARDGDAILFKGSRGTRVEKALERFCQ